ncbi:hypothetical protein [Sphingomonas sp. Y38-1Y]|uniref:hypothetical protein n=1 Tax=Sphingomonas sp. Y38-1Y TaxID=3078265 RepID=UPI0028E96570|nr:hypothetical protein [Sphingomonas sp. Y38-1Y]
MKRLAILLVVIALGLPALLLGTRMGGAADVMVEPAEPIEFRTPPPLAAALERPLFEGEGAAPLPADAPELIGIAGRLDRDAVAMVRGRDGTVRTLKPGEGIDGWQLRSLAIDAAYFTRGGQSARVAMPGE